MVDSGRIPSQHFGGVTFIEKDEIEKAWSEALAKSVNGGPDKSGSGGETLALTVPEAAKELRSGNTSMRGLVDSGQVPSFRIGHSVRIPREGLRQWVVEQWNGESEREGRNGRNEDAE